MADRQSQASKILAVASRLTLFHSKTDEFALIETDGHEEVWPLRSAEFTTFILSQYYKRFADVPNRYAMEEAIGTLRGRAKFDHEMADVAVRVAHVDGCIYVDIGDKDWSVAEVTKNGWEIISKSPVRFIRTPRMAALPIPELGGDLRDISEFINVRPEDVSQCIGWVVGSFMPSGPYSVLVVDGEQGSAKSTTSRILKALVDPTKPELGSPPQKVDDFIVSARYAWVYSIDNISHVPSWLSDALCRLSTGGGGISKRLLYSNGDEFVMDATRPALINGIGDPVTRSDLRDRGVFIRCVGFTETNKKIKPERTFWKEWSNAYPKMFGAVLSALVLALHDIDNVPLDNLPRMADFAQWICAASPMWGMSAESTLSAYNENRREAHGVAIESSIVATELLRFVERVGAWSGTSTTLLEELSKSPGVDARQHDWPKNGQSLSNALMRLSPNLRAFGVKLSRGMSGSGVKQQRTITIQLVESHNIVQQRIRKSVSIRPDSFVAN